MDQFNAPIPGESLTRAPKNAPYERPPQFTDPRDALKYHLRKLDNPEVLDAAFTFLETGVDLKTLTEGITRGAVANGIHSIDVSLMVQPAIHEFIRVMASKAGVEFDEGFVDKEQQRIEEEFKTEVMARKRMGQEPVAEEPMVEETEPMEEPEEAPRRGLMERSMT
jgi:hypothetical protein